MKKLKFLLIAALLASCAARVPEEKPITPVKPTEQKKEVKPILKEVAVIVLTAAFRAIIR